jgi:alkanesulfonate monooxygenase SsuD/methylene tetrahydromethanopterin reductase-like flavin-dependent oxidoreductase (luciferase family)
MTAMTVPERGTGIVLRDALPWHDELQIVRTAEESGYSAVFVPEIEAREAFGTLAGFASATDRVRLGTGVVTVHARSPVTAAMGAATVNQASGGRFILGIGAGSPGGPPGSALAPGGIKPLALMEEYVRVVRAILSGERADSAPLGVRGFRLGMDAGDPPPRVWVGALGDRMVALAGRVADGVILNWCTPERVAAARGVLRASAEAAGRDPDDVTIAVYVRACLGIEEGLALPSLRSMTGLYASYPPYLAQLRAIGLGDDADSAAAAHRDGKPEQVPESLVRALAIIGGRAEAQARFDEFRAAGADLVLCYPVVAGTDALSSVLGTVLAAATTTE